jgi:Skp family chaperone for outer membrane proteins
MVITAFGVGCNNDKGNKGNSSEGGGGATAVVDLDKVARDLGWQAKLQSNLETYRNKLQEDVKTYDAKYSEQIKQTVGTMVPQGTKPTDEVKLTLAQSQQLSNLISAGRQQLGEVAQQGNQLFNQYRVDWVKQYREALGPIVRQVAEENKINVVLTQSDQVLFADRMVDLTDKVVDAARAKMPTLTEVPMAQIKYSEQIRVNASPTVGGTSTQPTTQPEPAK